MRLNIRISLVFVLALVASSIAITQTINATQSNRWATVINQLLDHPAPPPPMLLEVAKVLAERRNENGRTNDELGDDASPNELIRFWEFQERRPTGKQPSEKVRWQLLEACFQPEGRDCSSVMNYLPDTPAGHERVKAYLDEPEQPISVSAYSLSKEDQVLLRKRRKGRFHDWLMLHSDYFRDDLLKKAREVSADRYQLKNQSSLEALVRLDWNAAKPILENYLNQAEPFVQTYALKQLYLHAVEHRETSQADAMRLRLLEIVSNPQTSEYAQGEAYDALTQREWPGRNEWFSALLAHENLLSRKNPLFSDDALANPIKAAPNDWNPLLSQLVASGNPTVHNNAALILATVALRKPNREALLPLLPWLTDPNWVTAGTEYDRYRIIKGSGELQLPEAVPGLLGIVQSETEFARIQAVEALARYRDLQVIARMIPILRAAIRQEPIDYSLEEMIRLLAANGGFTDLEVISAVESVATESTVTVDEWDEELWPNFQEPESLSAWIGHAVVWQHKFGPPNSYGVRRSAFTESVAMGLIARIKALQGERPDVAAKLWKVARALDFPVVNTALAERIVEADADLETTLLALRRRQHLAVSSGTTLQPIVKQNGYVSGLAAILLDDEDNARSILESKDREAQMALLASARVIRDGLPVDLVGKLLASTDKSLALAAERYLESEDSPAARQLILARHPDDALILGGAPDFDPKRKNEDDWIKWEEALRDVVKQGQAEEVFGEYQVYYSDAAAPDRKSFEIHVRHAQATACRRKDEARKECRALSPEELSELRSLFEEIHFDDVKPLSLPGSGYGGTVQKFVRLNKNGGRRVYASDLFWLHSDPGLALKLLTPHDKLNVFFAKLKTTGEYELLYALKEKNRDLEVVSADDKHPVSQVCGQDGEVRALVREDPDYYAQPKWKTVKEGKLGGEANQPPNCPTVDAREDLPEAMRKGAVYAYPLWKTQTRDGIVRSMTWNEQHALWFSKAGSEPRLLTKESEQPEAVTPDGRWVIAVKRNRDADSDLLRVDLKTGATTKIDVEGWTYPIVVEPLTGKIVIPTFRDNRKIYEVKLYTPATNQLEMGIGEFEPLKHQHDRSLQPIAGSTNEFWAAIPDPDAKKTRVGRYDARSFKFTSLMELPDIVFTSTSMWVDEKANWLYIAYNGHLLRLPLFFRK